MKNENYEERGIQDSKRFQGNPEILKAQLENILAENENFEEREDNKRNSSIKNLNSKKSTNERLIENYKVNEIKIREDIKQKEEEASTLRKQMISTLDGSAINDTSESGNQTVSGNSTTNRWLEIFNFLFSRVNKSLKHENSRLLTGFLAFVFLFLTIYLFIFYSTTFYSAFSQGRGEITNEVINEELNTDNPNTKEFNTQESKILHFEAFSEVWSKPTLSERLFGVIFLAVAPFVFYTLGLLMYGARRIFISPLTRYSVLIFLYTVAFFFDAVIAYRIVKTNYIAESRDFNIFNEILMPSWDDLSLMKQIGNLDFFSVLVGGFIVYLLWGLLLTWLMIQVNKSAYLKLQIAEINYKISQLKDTLIEETSKKSQISNENAEFDRQIKFLREQISINKSSVKNAALLYISGWINSIIDENKNDKNARERLLDNSIVVRKDFLRDLDSEKYINDNHKKD